MLASLGRGAAHYHSGHLNRALKSYQQALLLAQVRDQQIAAAEIYISIGSIELLLNNYSQAKNAFSIAQRLSQASDNNTVSVQAMIGLGDLYFQLKKYPQSRQYFQQAQKLIDQKNTKKHVSAKIRVSNGIAINLKAEGQLNQALASAEQAVELSQNSGLEKLLADSRFNKASIQFAMGNSLDAKGTLLPALQHDKSLERLTAIYSDLMLLARIEASLGNNQAAQQHQTTANTIRQHLRR